MKCGEKNHVGDLIYFNEHLGDKHRLKFYAITIVANNPNKVVFQMRKCGVNLPGYLDLEFHDTPEGLALKHEVRIGWQRFGKIIDSIIRLFFNKSFFKALASHCDREWVRLAEILEG